MNLMRHTQKAYKNLSNGGNQRFLSQFLGKWELFKVNLHNLVKKPQENRKNESCIANHLIF